MKFKTLSLIHKLLEEEKNKQLAALQKARACYNSALNEEKDNNVIEVYKELKDTCFDKYNEVLDSLKDFENKEW